MEQDKPAAEEISTQIMALQSPPDLASLLKFDALKKDARWPQVSESCKSLEPVKQAKTKLAEVTQQYNEAGVAAMSELITAVQAIQPPAANAPPGGKSPQDQISDLKQQDRYRLWLNATVLAALPQAAAKVTEAKGAITAKEAELAAAQTNATNAAGGGAPDPAASQRDLLERQKKDIINVLEGMAAQIQVEAMQIDVAASGIATGLGLLAATGVAAPLAAVLAGLGAGALGLLQSRKSRKVGAELKVLVEQVKEASDAAAIGAIFEQLRTELESFEVFKAELGAKLGAARPAQPARMGAAEKVEHGAHGAHVIVEGVSVASHAVHHLTESFMPGLGVLILAYKTILHSSHFEHLEHEIHEKKEVEERLRAGGEAGGGAGGDHGGGGGGGH